MTPVSAQPHASPPSPSSWAWLPVSGAAQPGGPGTLGPGPAALFLPQSPLSANSPTGTPPFSRRVGNFSPSPGRPGGLEKAWASQRDPRGGKQGPQDGPPSCLGPRDLEPQGWGVGAWGGGRVGAGGAAPAWAEGRGGRPHFPPELCPAARRVLSSQSSYSSAGRVGLCWASRNKGPAGGGVGGARGPGAAAAGPALDARPARTWRSLEDALASPPGRPPWPPLSPTLPLLRRGPQAPGPGRAPPPTMPSAPQVLLVCKRPCDVLLPFQGPPEWALSHYIGHKV